MANDFNGEIIEEFRANDGNVGGMFEGTPLLLLHTTGAKSGQARINPLAYRKDADNLAVFGTKGGAPTHPAWYHNVRAHPNVHVEVGTEKFDATARVAEGDERRRIWELQKQDVPGFAGYEQKTDRKIPVVILERVAS